MCEANRVPFFFKQWGGRTAKAGGRVLDGVVYGGMPALAVPRQRTASLFPRDTFRASDHS
jgi:hypothetical protein